MDNQNMQSDDNQFDITGNDKTTETEAVQPDDNQFNITGDVQASEAVQADDCVAVESPYKNGFTRGLDKFYGITKVKSSIKVEIFAGIATFLAMCYILVVNPNMILTSDAIEANASFAALWPSVFIATAFGAIIGTLLMSLVAKMPYAQAPGMGLNSMVGSMLGGVSAGGATIFFSFGTAMLLVLISGAIFLLLSLVPGGRNKETGKLVSLREYIFDGIPKALRTAIPVGIGLFIAYVGLINARAFSFGFIPDLVQMNDYTSPYGASGLIVCLIGLIVIAILSHFKVKAAVVIGIVVATLIGIPMGVSDVTILQGQSAHISWAFWENFATFFSMDADKGGAFLAAFTDVDFSGTSVMYCIMTVVAFCMVDMFDTMGTITGCAARAGLLDKEGKPINFAKCMYADSIATCAGAALGTSTVTTFVESGTGIATGGKTGLTSLVVAILFLLSIFLLPVFAFIPQAAASSALVYVGVLMMSNVKNIDFSQIKNAVPAFLTIAVMPFGYSITDGIGVGLLAYFIIALLEFVIETIVAAAKKTEKPKFDIPVVTIIVAVLFAVYFFVPSNI